MAVTVDPVRLEPVREHRRVTGELRAVRRSKVAAQEPGLVIEFPVREGTRREGDPPALYAEPAKIRSELGWSARFTDLDEIIATAWGWRRAHPDGYAP